MIGFEFELPEDPTLLTKKQREILILENLPSVLSLIRDAWHSKEHGKFIQILEVYYDDSMDGLKEIGNYRHGSEMSEEEVLIHFAEIVYGEVVTEDIKLFIKLLI
jgi:hypothetical protein